MIRLHFLKVLLIASTVSLLGSARARAAEPAPVKIGMLKSMFRGVSPGVFAAMSTPFHTLMEAQTGLKGDLVLVETPDEMRQQLDNGVIQLGAFHGFEFAWMKLKEPNLQPLMLAASNPNCLKTVVVVGKDCACNSVEELRGKDLAMPVATREHSRLFVARQCRKYGRTVQEHFAATPSPNTVEDALHDVVDGKAHAAVVEMNGLQMFERRNPGRYAKLRIVQSSDVFPASVIAYKSGSLDELTLQKFRTGMATAHKSLLGTQLMGLMKMTSFEPIPANYDQVIAETIKVYPPPWVVAKR